MWAHNALTEFGETAIAVKVGNCWPAISRKFVLHDTWHFRNATFYFWCRSLRSEMSCPWAVLAGLSYFFMVSTWGGYVFVVNVVVTWPWLQAMFVGFQVHPRTFCIQTRLTTCRIITWIWSGENVKMLDDVYRGLPCFLHDVVETLQQTSPCRGLQWLLDAFWGWLVWERKGTYGRAVAGNQGILSFQGTDDNKALMHMGENKL